METLDLIPGTQEWHAVRATHFTASEAPAMMGASKYLSRNELLKQKHTGIAPDVDVNKQRLFDKGHEAEALARPIVEERLGEELFPAVGKLVVDGLPLLASFDGLPMDESINWENKLWNEGLVAAIRAGELDPHYHWQLEQQLLVSGAKKAYFTSSDGTEEKTVGCWYKSVPERRSSLIAGWKQFAEDLKNYQHVEVVEPPKADVIAQLPVVVVSVSGSLSASNLAMVVPKFDAFLETAKTVLTTDEDFANGESTAKFSRTTAKAIRTKAKEVIEQISDVSEAVRVLELYADKFDALGLKLEKAVKEQKESIRLEIINAAKLKLSEHIINLNRRVRYMPAVAADFVGAVKNKRTVESLRNAVDTELARAKIEASAIADLIEANRTFLAESNAPEFLFSDIATICTKDAEDFQALVKIRVTEHAEREAKLATERKRLDEMPIAKNVPATDPEFITLSNRFEPPVKLGVMTGARPTFAAEQTMTEAHPTDDQIIATLAYQYRVHESKVIEWLLEMDLDAASERMAAEFA